MIDSGSFFSAISAKEAAALKLPPVNTPETGSHLPSPAAVLTGGAGGGQMVTELVMAQGFAFGRAHFKNLMLLAEPRLNDTDGILGQDFLRAADVEYDLSGGIVRLTQAEGCNSTNMAYWAKNGQAYSVLPLESTESATRQTQAAIFVDGVKMRAVFDTGAPVSYITESAALRAGVKVTDPGVTSSGPAHGLDRDFKSWTGTFASVKIGDEEIKNSPLQIGATDTQEFDVLLGADFFMAHHVYVANSQGKIYFTYSGGPVFGVGRYVEGAASAN